MDGSGELRVDVRRGPSGTPPPEFAVTLEDDAGGAPTTAMSNGRDRVSLSSQVSPGDYYLSVAPRDRKHRGVLYYEIRANYRPPPPPPPRDPPFKTISCDVLEVEMGDVPVVLISAGRDSALRSGLAGRLVQGGEVIGKLKIVEVYDEGSRARIEGTLAAPITPTTVVQIDVPLEGGPLQNAP
jgi:hypothetical protein